MYDVRERGAEGRAGRGKHEGSDWRARSKTGALRCRWVGTEYSKARRGSERSREMQGGLVSGADRKLYHLLKVSCFALLVCTSMSEATISMHAATTLQAALRHVSIFEDALVAAGLVSGEQGRPLKATRHVYTSARLVHARPLEAHCVCGGGAAQRQRALIVETYFVKLQAS
eukprot:6201603-Pleurochrysis_carterae.AAC.5